MMRHQPQVFSNRWFKLHQTALLWWANTLIGRLILGIPVHEWQVRKLRPEACAMSNDGIHYHALIYAGKQYANRLYYALKPVWYLLHGLDMIGGTLSLGYNFGFDTTTIYSPAGGAATCGYFLDDISKDNTAFATVRAANGAGGGYNGAALNVRLCSGATTLYGYIYRGLATFDISSARPAGGRPNSVIVSAATVSLYCGIKYNAAGTPTLQLTLATPHDYISPTNTDYAIAHFGAAAASSVAYASITGSAYNDIALNAAAITAINAADPHVGFGALTGWDFANNATGFTPSPAAYSGFNFYANTINKYPKLALTYTVEATLALTGASAVAAGIGYVFGKATLAGSDITAYKFQIATEPTFAAPEVDSGWVGGASSAGILSLVSAWADPTAGTHYVRVGIQSTYFYDTFSAPVSFVINFPTIASLSVTQNRELCKVTVVVSDEYVDPPEVMVVVDGHAYKGTLQ